MEDYLEAVLLLSEEDGSAKINAIGKRLGVSMPTVNSAVGKLAAQGLVRHERYGDVTLTGEGEEVARVIYHRHVVLARFFNEILGVDPETSRRDACEIEHSLSDETDGRLSSFVEFILEAPGRPEWLKNFSEFCETGERPEGCRRRLR